MNTMDHLEELDITIEIDDEEACELTEDDLEGDFDPCGACPGC
jgi:hypothetical protein